MPASCVRGVTLFGTTSNIGDNQRRGAAMTMRKLVLSAAFAAVSAIATATAQAETLRVGMECTYAPFNFRAPGGEMTGYDVDVAKGVAELIGADLQYVCQQ